MFVNCNQVWITFQSLKTRLPILKHPTTCLSLVHCTVLYSTVQCAASDQRMSIHPKKKPCWMGCAPIEETPDDCISNLGPVETGCVQPASFWPFSENTPNQNKPHCIILSRHAAHRLVLWCSSLGFFSHARYWIMLVMNPNSNLWETATSVVSGISYGEHLIDAGFVRVHFGASLRFIKGYDVSWKVW